MTQDDDFLRLAAQWQTSGRPFAGVAFALQGGTSIGQLVEDLELLATCAAEDELHNRVTYLPLP